MFRRRKRSQKAKENGNGAPLSSTAPPLATSVSGHDLDNVQADGPRLRHATLSRPKQAGKAPPSRRRYSTSSTGSAASISSVGTTSSPTRPHTDNSDIQPAPLLSAATSSTLNESVNNNNNQQNAASPRRQKSERSDKEKKIGHRKVDKDGEVNYKKVKSSALMESIQMGIRVSIGYAAQRKHRDLLQPDFYEVESLPYPKEGSKATPAHHHDAFKFYSYAPYAFRFFRDFFDISTEDFLMSLCDKPLRELSNPGASGSVFYLSGDDQFIIKTVQKREHEFLLSFFPGYYMNLDQNKKTLLPKFFGLFNYQSSLGKNIRFIVMNNLLPSGLAYYQRYDLKGSSYGRSASAHEKQKKSPTLKDNDFRTLHKEGILLEPDTYDRLSNTIRKDCMVLESFKIMDYSLLVGMHRLGKDDRKPKKDHSVHQMSIQKGQSERSSLFSANGDEADTEEGRDGADVRGFTEHSTFLNGQYIEQKSLFGETEFFKRQNNVPSGYGVMTGKEVFLFRDKKAKTWVFSTSLSGGETLASLSSSSEHPADATGTWQVQGLDGKVGSGGTEVSVDRVDALHRKKLTRKPSFSFNNVAEQITVTSETESDTASNTSVRLDEHPLGGLIGYLGNGDRVLIFVGIIDILQSYVTKKRLEHAFKALIHDGDTVSVTHPKFYAKRFTNFMLETVFRKVDQAEQSHPSEPTRVGHAVANASFRRQISMKPRDDKDTLDAAGGRPRGQASPTSPRKNFDLSADRVPAAAAPLVQMEDSKEVGDSAASPRASVCDSDVEMDVSAPIPVPAPASVASSSLPVVTKVLVEKSPTALSSTTSSISGMVVGIDESNRDNAASDTGLPIISAAAAGGDSVAANLNGAAQQLQAAVEANGHVVAEALSPPSPTSAPASPPKTVVHGAVKREEFSLV